MEIFTSSPADLSCTELKGSLTTVTTNLDLQIRPSTFWRTLDLDGESDFGDKDCGEPESHQKLVVDFTPNPERDTLFEQQKCNDFWMFIREQRHLAHLKVYPKETVSGSSSSGADTDSNASTSPASESVDSDSLKGKTAISLFSLPENQERLNGALTTNMKGSDCSFKGSDYTVNDVYTVPKEEKKSCEFCPKNVCRIPALCICPNKPRATSKKKGPHPTAKTLCKIFDDWDKKHPKSMEPPGHPPLLVDQCILQKLPQN